MRMENEWSPEAAMEAYIYALHLKYNHEDGRNTDTRLVEPKSMEFVAALAAGNRSKLIVQVTAITTSPGLTPLTITLAVAAKQTGGRLVCILPQEEEAAKRRNSLQRMITTYHKDLKDAIEFVVGNPTEIIKNYKRIDFAVIDCKYEDHMEVLKSIDLNPRRCMVLMNNKSSDGSLVKIHARKDINGFKGINGSVSLPIGEGMVLSRFGSSSPSAGNNKNKITRSRRYKRFHVTFEG